jgi:hypothetical protein
LFFETTLADKSTVLYTLKDEDHLGYPSLYRLFMEFEDVTEWEFAQAYMDGWEHWQMLCACTWFKPYVTRWRQELELKLKAKALKAIRAEAEGEGKMSYAANKFLMEGGWKEKDTSAKPGRGRPVKDNSEKEAILEKEAKLRVNEDFERLNIKPN